MSQKNLNVLRPIGTGTDKRGIKYLIVAWTTPDGRLSDPVAIPRAEIGKSPNAVLQYASRAGFPAPISHAARAKAIADLDIPESELPPWIVIVEAGWLPNGTFALPSGLIGHSVETNALVNMSTDHKFGQSGTLSDWQTNVAELADGNSLPMFSIMYAMSGLLLSKTGVEPGGIQYVGPTSCGKTTCAVVAGSFFGGGGPNGFAESWNATSNALELLAKAYSDTLLILDETGLAGGTPKEKAEAICSLPFRCAGRQLKRRMNDTGTVNWSTLYLSTSEISLHEAAQRANQPLEDGIAARHTDIFVDADQGYGAFENAGTCGSSGELAAKLKANALRYYGTAAPAYISKLIECLTQDPAEFQRKLSKRMKKMMSLIKPTTPVEERIARRFALAYAAGRFGRDFGILNWSIMGMRSAVLMVYSRTTTDGRIDPLTRSFVSRLQDCVTASDAAKTTKVLRAKVAGQEEFLLRRSTMERLCGGSVATKLVLADLKAKGLLRTESKSKKYGVTHRSDGARSRYYAISIKVLKLI